MDNHLGCCQDDVFSKAECKAVEFVLKQQGHLRRKTPAAEGVNLSEWTVLTLRDVSLFNFADVPTTDLRRFYLWTATSVRGDVKICGMVEQKAGHGNKVEFEGVRICDPAPSLKIALKFYKIGLDEAGEARSAFELCGRTTLNWEALEKGYLNEMCGDWSNLVHIKAEVFEPDQAEVSQIEQY